MLSTAPLPTPTPSGGMQNLNDHPEILMRQEVDAGAGPVGGESRGVRAGSTRCVRLG